MDEKLISGSQCNTCGKVFFPPKAICPECVHHISDLVPLPSTGVIKNLINVQNTKRDMYGLIQIDKSDTTFIMRILNIKRKKIRPGVRVKVVWANGKKVNSPHIIGFEPI
ncbi:MAG: Zn-ribbon domain-containing OB-fold protein [Candidatus Thorarchaeota archaeon]